MRNCLAAAAAAEALEIPLDTIAQASRRWSPFAGGWKWCRRTGRSRSSSITPTRRTALVNVLATVGKLLKGDGRLIVVFGCGGNRDRKKRPEMAEVAEELADRVIVTSDNPRSRSPRRSSRRSSGASRRRKCRRSSWTAAPLSTWLSTRPAPGDVIVIAGKGHETYQIDRERDAAVRRPRRSAPESSAGRRRAVKMNEVHLRRPRRAERQRAAPRGRGSWTFTRSSELVATTSGRLAARRSGDAAAARAGSARTRRHSPAGPTFLALRGERLDGHAFLIAAARRGACVADHRPRGPPAAERRGPRRRARRGYAGRPDRPGPRGPRRG